MIRSSRSRWVSGIGTVVLIGGLALANFGSGITSAEATNPPPNPFKQILNKLDQILAAITGGGGGGNHTLRWDTNNPSASRFTTAFPGAVLDKNTGLVWEQAPDTTNYYYGDDATSFCVNKTVGNTRGWRLPSVAELASVIDPTLPPPFVPAGVFTGVQQFFHWSASAVARLPGFAWFVAFDTGVVGIGNKSGTQAFAWCVRGPMQESVY